MLKLGLFLGLLTLAFVAGGCGQPASGLDIDQLSVKEVYARLEQALKRPGQVFHTTVRISQEAGPLSYQGKFELWAAPLQGQVRQIAELTFKGGETSRHETVLADGLVYGPPSQGIAMPKHRAPQCPEAGVLVSVVIGCLRFDQFEEISVETVRYEGAAAVLLTNKVAWSGSDENFDGTRRLYLDAETFLPIALHFDGTMDFGEVSAVRGRGRYENDYLPLDDLPDDFFDPVSVGYVEPDAQAPLKKSGHKLTVHRLGMTSGGAVALPARLPS